MMKLVDEPGTRRLFVNDMRGPLYSVSYDGKAGHAVSRYQRADVGRERAVAGQRARLPELRVPPAVRQPGTPGFGKFYTYTDTSNQTPAPDFTTAQRRRPRTTRCCSSGRRRRRAPRPTTAARRASCSASRSRSRTTTPGTWRSTRSPRPAAPTSVCSTSASPTAAAAATRCDLAQNLGSAFGKILRIDPLGTNSANSKYGIPAGNPFVNDGRRAPRDLRLRRPQSAALRLGLAERQHVPRRHRPEHRRGDQPRDRRAPISAGTTGRAASASSAGRRSASRSRAAIRR